MGPTPDAAGSIDQIANVAVLAIVAVALLLGLGSMVIGQIVAWYDAWRGRTMSTAAPAPAPTQPIAAPVAREGAEPLQPIATPCNDRNAELRDNSVAQPLPDEVRDIIRWQATAEAAAAVLEAGWHGNQAEVIEILFRCSRNSRPGSEYSRARAAVEAQRSPVAQRGDGTYVERATGEPLFAVEGGGYRTRDGRLVQLRRSYDEARP